MLAELNKMLFSGAVQRISVRVVLKHSVVNKAVDQWRPRLRTRVCDKGKEVYSYRAILSSISKRSDMNHTVLPANYTMSAFPS